MTKDEIIILARSTGVHAVEFAEIRSSKLFNEGLEKFAALIANAEREACARVCESNEVYIDVDTWANSTKKDIFVLTGKKLASKVRRRLEPR